MTGNAQAESAQNQTDPKVTEKIRQLNDEFRRTGTGGVTTITMGVHELGSKAVTEIRKAVSTFTGFSKDNDPHGEHDFGNISYNGRMVFWKIDYYDEDIAYESPDPTDPEVKIRVMTILLSTEY